MTEFKRSFHELAARLAGVEVPGVLAVPGTWKFAPGDATLGYLQGLLTGQYDSMNDDKRVVEKERVAALEELHRRGATMILSDTVTHSGVTYHQDYLPREEADRLLAWMQTEAPWQVEELVMFGVSRVVKRRTCAFSVQEGSTYTYSGTTKVATRWPAILGRLLAQVRYDTGVEFNFALANLYPDGSAGIGAHADDEASIVPASPIVGVSLGATRDFVIEKKTGERVAVVPLEHGSAVMMWGETQRHYKHALPPRKRVKTPRVSLTFRVMR